MNLKSLEKKLTGFIDLNERIIDLEGDAEVIIANLLETPTLDYHYEKDFLMFCISKFTKTLKAIRLLLQNNLNEDALILTRSNYEVMIHAKALIKDRVLIKHFVEYKFGLENERFYRYARNKRGKPIFNKIIDKSKPNVEIEYISSISDIAKRAKESKSHKYIYKFLCEQTHCNFITSGYYREGVFYSLNSKSEQAKTNVILFNIGFCLKLFYSCLESELLGEEFEELEDILCTVLMNEKLALHKWFEQEEQRVKKLIINDDNSNELVKHLKQIEAVKWALLQD